MEKLNHIETEVYTIAIIGAGQLGSRHLQGLKKASVEMFIYVVDTNSV